MFDTDFERDELIRAGAPVATLLRDQSFVVLELVRRVREEAEKLPFVLSAWVRPDGRRYVMTGIGDLDSYERAAEASTRIYREFTPRLGIDGKMVLTEAKTIWNKCPFTKDYKRIVLTAVRNYLRAGGEID
ncbi:MAG: hypothetical protein ACHREM_08795 [Polyangiales bacterium]